MSKFLTVDELQTRMGLDELLQLAGLGSARHDDGRTLDREKVEAALKFSDDLVIAKLRERYKTIVDITPQTTPDLLKGFVEDITRYRLRLRSGGQSQMSEEVRQRYEDACRFLKEVQSGKSSLDIPGDLRGEATSANTVMSSMPQNRAEQILDGYAS